MNKKEIAEIRKQFSPERCAITRICSCYVDAEKNKRTSMKEAFLSLPEEEIFKYLEIFKKTLSGHIGKNLLNLEYSIRQEVAGTPHAFLTELRDTELNNNELIDEFYDRVIKNYVTTEPYYIVLIHGAYDIPGKATDNSEMFDTSENVYEFIMCSICPVKLAKAGLFYDVKSNKVENRIRDWLVDAPAHGFLFPAFNDREADIHESLYYAKKPDSVQEDFTKVVVGTQISISVAKQQEAFNKVLETVIGENGSIEEVLAVHEKLQEMILESEFSVEPLELDKEKARRLFEDVVKDGQGALVNNRMDSFDAAWNAEVGEKFSFLVNNIAASKNLNIKCGSAEIKIPPQYAYQIREKIIDGIRCLVIPTDGLLTVNDVKVNVRIGAENHE